MIGYSLALAAGSPGYQFSASLINPGLTEEQPIGTSAYSCVSFRATRSRKQVARRGLFDLKVPCIWLLKTSSHGHISFDKEGFPFPPSKMTLSWLLQISPGFEHTSPILKERKFVLVRKERGNNTKAYIFEYSFCSLLLRQTTSTETGPWGLWRVVLYCSFHLKTLTEFCPTPLTDSKKIRTILFFSDFTLAWIPKTAVFKIKSFWIEAKVMLWRHTWQRLDHVGWTADPQWHESLVSSVTLINCASTVGEEDSRPNFRTSAHPLRAFIGLFRIWPQLKCEGSYCRK